MLVPVSRRIGRFEISRKLGRGGMGDVYLARDTAGNYAVALKLIEHADDPDTRDGIAAEKAPLQGLWAGEDGNIECGIHQKASVPEPQQDAEGILGLAQLNFQSRNGGLGIGQQGLGLFHVALGGDAEPDPASVSLRWQVYDLENLLSPAVRARETTFPPRVDRAPIVREGVRVRIGPVERTPFTFAFYTAASSDFRVGNNGAVMVGATSGDIGYTNAALPQASLPNTLMLYWDDLYYDSTGDVYWQVLGTAPNRTLVIEWYLIPHISGSSTDPGTFEMILYEGSNNIEFIYTDTTFGNATYNNGASATVGINQSATNALQYEFNTPGSVPDGRAICFYPPAPAPRLDFSTKTASGTMECQNEYSMDYVPSGPFWSGWTAAVNDGTVLFKGFEDPSSAWPGAGWRILKTTCGCWRTSRRWRSRSRSTRSARRPCPTSATRCAASG